MGETVCDPRVTHRTQSYRSPNLNFDLDALGVAYYVLARGQLGELGKRMKDAAAGTQAQVKGTEALQMRRMIVQGS